MTIQSVDPDIEQEQIPEDLGKLTEVDKARIGRVSFSRSLKIKLLFRLKLLSCQQEPKQTMLCCCIQSYFIGIAQISVSIYLSR